MPVRTCRHRASFVGILLGAMIAAGIWAGAATPAAARCIPVAMAPGKSDQHAAVRSPAPAPRVTLARLVQASEGGATKLPAGQVELTFLGHSSFLIRTHQNATAVTDYNDYHRPNFPPDIVTMNRAHTTHWTMNIQKGVKHVLRGWAEGGKIPRHNVLYKDLRVTNVPTNIRDGGSGIAGMAGNSIFIFESAGLCIVHLGHLHHNLRRGHAGRVGMVDVLLAPIDDGWTMPQADLLKVIDTLKPEVVIPMHYGYGDTLPRFLASMKARKFAIRELKGPSVRFSKATLPPRQTVVVLQGGGL